MNSTLNLKQILLVFLASVVIVNGGVAKRFRSQILNEDGPGQPEKRNDEPVSDMISYYGGAKDKVLLTHPSGATSVATKDADLDAALGYNGINVHDGAASGASSGGAAASAVNNNPSNDSESSSENASVAEAKPVGLAIVGAGGTAIAKPVGSAIAGPGGVAIARPVGTAIAGVEGAENLAIGGAIKKGGAGGAIAGAAKPTIGSSDTASSILTPGAGFHDSGDDDESPFSRIRR